MTIDTHSLNDKTEFRVSSNSVSSLRKRVDPLTHLLFVIGHRRRLRFEAD